MKLLSKSCFAKVAGRPGSNKGEATKLGGGLERQSFTSSATKQKSPAQPGFFSLTDV
jgi:hypothetical protein